MCDNVSEMRMDVAASNIASDVTSDVVAPNSIVILYEEDGMKWADFFKSKLTGPNYSLNTCVQAFSDCDPYTLPETSKLQVILISPSLLDNKASVEKLLTFRINSCVLILLGVDKSDVKTLYEKDCDDILQYPHHVIEEDSNICASLKEAFVKIIQCYEDDKVSEDNDIYEYLPMGKPIQVNKLLDVFPSSPLTGGSDVYLLLEREADEKVNIVIDRDGGKVIPAQYTKAAVYRVTIPEETTGQVSFRVESEQKLLGQHEAQAKSKLEQLNSLLLDTTDPLAIMCQSLGIPKTTAALDRKLTEQLKKNCSTHSMPVLMQMFESQDHTDETSSEMWPTVLHFAAEYNLELFCTELLKCPGMVNAATVSNVNEQYPCEIAQEKGFTGLSKQLFSIVEKHGRHIDSGVVVDPPPPCPGQRYVNNITNTENDDEYIQMDNLDTSVLSSHFNHEGNGDGPDVRIVQKPVPKVRKSLKADTSDQNIASHSAGPSQPLHFDNMESSDDHDVLPNQSMTKQPDTPDDTDKPEPLSELLSKLSAKPGAKKTNGARPKKHTVSDLGDLRHLPPPPQVDPLSSFTPFPPTKPRSCSLGTENTIAPLKRIQKEDPRCSGMYEQVFDDESPEQIPSQVPPPLREVKKVGRFSKFLNKLKRVPTESDLIVKVDKKTKIFSRSGNGSDPDLTQSPTKRLFQRNLSKSVSAGKKYSDTLAHPTELERDSGSYSDDDDDDDETSSTTSSPGHRKKQMVKSASVFKSPSALSRTKSVRVVKALAEKMDNAPNLPSRPEKDEY